MIVPFTVPWIVTEPVPLAVVELVLVGVLVPLMLPAITTCPLGPSKTSPRVTVFTLPLTSTWAPGPRTPNWRVVSEVVRGVIAPSSSTGAATMLPICPDLMVEVADRRGTSRPCDNGAGSA